MNFVIFGIVFYAWYFLIIDAEHVIDPTNNVASFCLKASSTVNFKVYVKNPDQIDESSQGLDFEINRVKFLIDIDRGSAGTRAMATIENEPTLLYLDDAGYFDFAITEASGMTMEGWKLNLYPIRKDDKYTVHVNGILITSEFKIESDDEISCADPESNHFITVLIVVIVLAIVALSGVLIVCCFNKNCALYDKCRKDKDKKNDKTRERRESGATTTGYTTPTQRIHQTTDRKYKDEVKMETDKESDVSQTIK